ncbi:MAG: tRNA (adenosine(37)-N6)-threonylcarbamoyltransferase complex dimerization subunit type 1 TsaB [Chloroflexota bacterium]|nr:tRNA (adenosine(37)-N6)-threonylcarbamoyltransferase complex dimerization subunit type 1 TsaB [Chloroflexota bacterium]
MELSIDTATGTAGIALSIDGEIRIEMSWQAGQNHTVELLPNILKVMEQANAGFEDIRNIIVSIGPGSFNGLRAGLSTAKGLAFSLNIPIIAVGTLEAEAFPHAEAGLPVCPVQDAARGEFAAALYQSVDGEWRKLVPEHITMLEDLCARIATDIIVCGRFSPDVKERIAGTLGSKTTIVNNTFCRAGIVSKLGWQRIERGESDDVATLQPLYLRRPSITKPRESKR